MEIDTRRLTFIQTEILNHFLDGRQPKEIGKLLGIKTSTISGHIKAIREKGININKVCNSYYKVYNYEDIFLVDSQLDIVNLLIKGHSVFSISKILNKSQGSVYACINRIRNKGVRTKNYRRFKYKVELDKGIRINKNQQAIIRLLSKGMSVKDVSLRLGYHINTIYNAIVTLELKYIPMKDIKTIKYTIEDNMFIINE